MPASAGRAIWFRPLQACSRGCTKPKPPPCPLLQSRRSRTKVSGRQSTTACAAPPRRGAFEMRILLTLLLLFGASLAAAQPAPLPRIETRDGRHALIVDG